MSEDDTLWTPQPGDLLQVRGLLDWSVITTHERVVMTRDDYIIVVSRCEDILVDENCYKYLISCVNVVLLGKREFRLEWSHRSSVAQVGFGNYFRRLNKR
jgi:hypothetical protein